MPIVVAALGPLATMLLQCHFTRRCSDVPILGQQCGDPRQSSLWGACERLADTYFKVTLLDIPIL